MEKVKISKDGSAIDFVQSDKIPVSLKKFRQSPELEGFYRFIFENDLRKEALNVIDRIYLARKAAKLKKPLAQLLAEKKLAASNKDLTETTTPANTEVVNTSKKTAAPTKEKNQPATSNKKDQKIAAASTTVKPAAKVKTAQKEKAKPQTKAKAPVAKIAKSVGKAKTAGKAKATAKAPGKVAAKKSSQLKKTKSKK